jgi:hypothetical protein
VCWPSFDGRPRPELLSGTPWVEIHRAPRGGATGFRRGPALDAIHSLLAGISADWPAAAAAVLDHPEHAAGLGGQAALRAWIVEQVGSRVRGTGLHQAGRARRAPRNPAAGADASSGGASGPPAHSLREEGPNAAANRNGDGRRRRGGSSDVVHGTVYPLYLLRWLWPMKAGEGEQGDTLAPRSRRRAPPRQLPSPRFRAATVRVRWLWELRRGTTQPHRVHTTSGSGRWRRRLSNRSAPMCLEGQSPGRRFN